MSGPQMPCPGVKGHGIQNVPGAWYDLGTHLDSACAVLYWLNESLPSLEGLSDNQREHLNRASALAVAAEQMLDLAKKDVDDLERQLIAP